MKKKLISLTLSLLLIVFASLESYAEIREHIGNMGKGFQDEGMPMAPPMRDYGRGKMEGMPEAEHPMWKHLMELGLNEKQKVEIREIRNRVIKEMIKKRADARVARIEMKELIGKEPVDMKTVETKLRQIEALKTEIQVSLIRATEEAKSKLTPEQRKKFKEMIEIAPDMGPPMMGAMRHDSMRMPPPPPRKQWRMQQDMEDMPEPPHQEFPVR